MLMIEPPPALRIEFLEIYGLWLFAAVLVAIGIIVALIGVGMPLLTRHIRKRPPDSK